MAKTKGPIYDQLAKWSTSGQKGLGWLIDPDKFVSADCNSFFLDDKLATALDFILVGGSEIGDKDFSLILAKIKAWAPNKPILLFPGSSAQLSADADGLLFMSLLSGRNPRFLIEEQVKAARKVDELDVEVLPTAYLLINDGHLGSVHRASDTLPILNSQLEKCVDTALAGKLMGMRVTYLDAGSGLGSVVAPKVIGAVKAAVKGPLIVGGGIDTLGKLKASYNAGADLVIIGNAIEKNPSFLAEVLKFKELRNFSLHVN